VDKVLACHSGVKDEAVGGPHSLGVRLPCLSLVITKSGKLLW
jgi:hypothetical protein